MANLDSSWQKFIAEKQIDGALLMVLKNHKELTNQTTVELSLKNQVEINLLGQVEQDLVSFLRDDLKNDHIMVTHKLSVEQQQSRPYTNAEIFNEMAKKNPALLKLRDELGLDTDY